MDRAQLLSGLRTGGPRSASFSNNMPLSASPSGAFPRQQQYDVEDASDMFHAMNLGGGNPQQQAMFLQQLQAQQQMMAAGFAGNLSVNQAQAMQMQMELLRLQAIQQQQHLQAQLLLQSHLQVAQQQQQLNRRRSENHIMAMPATAGPTQSSFADSPMSVQQTRMNAAATLRARAINRETSPTPPLVGSEEQQQVPMSAALGGKFGSRGVAVASGGSPLNPHAAAFVGRFSPESISTNIAAGGMDLPQTPTHTNVISGGTSLGGSLNNSGSSTPTTVAASYNGLSGYSNTTPIGPSKSDTALSWRRGSSTGPGTPTTSKPPSPPLIGGGRAVSSSPVVNLGLGRLNTSNSGLSSIGSDSPGPSPLRARPQPLRFTTLPSNGTTAFSDRNSDNGDVVLTGDNASGSTKSGDSPVESSPPTSAGSGSAREREEASKRLYEGLGLGRPQQSPPASSTSFNLNSAAPVFKPQQPFPIRSQSLNTTPQIPTFSMTGPTPVTATGPANGMAPRPFSVPIRQPRGPPSGVEELGARNFASRMRKKALGGLGALMDARAERENVQAGMESVGELGLEEVVAY